MQNSKTNSANSAICKAVKLVRSHPATVGVEARLWPDVQDAFEQPGGILTQAMVSRNRVSARITWPKCRTLIRCTATAQNEMTAIRELIQN